MYTTVLSPEQAKQARIAVGRSQGRVAADLNL